MLLIYILQCKFQEYMRKNDAGSSEQKNGRCFVSWHLPFLNGNHDGVRMKGCSGMIAFINLTGIHAPGATDTLAHIDNRPFTAIHALYHSNSPGRTDTDAAATTFTFFPVKIIWHNGPDIINCFIHISSASSGVF